MAACINMIAAYVCKEGKFLSYTLTWLQHVATWISRSALAVPQFWKKTAHYFCNVCTPERQVLRYTLAIYDIVALKTSFILRENVFIVIFLLFFLCVSFEHEITTTRNLSMCLIVKMRVRWSFKSTVCFSSLGDEN